MMSSGISAPYNVLPAAQWLGVSTFVDNGLVLETRAKVHHCPASCSHHVGGT